MLDLQTAWFLLVGVLLVGYAVLDGFDLGVGILHLPLARTDRERRILMNAVGPVWDGNEVWLLTAGGALFAAFPPVYATVFSGLYLALMLLLLALMLRAVSLEFRSKEESPRWRAAWDGAFAFGSAVPALLFGVAIGNIVRGLPLTADGEFAGTFLGLLNPFALMVGALAVAMFTMQGGAWIALKTEGELRERAVRAARRACAVFLMVWALVTLFSRVAAPHAWAAYAHPAAWLAPLVGLACVLAFPVVLARGRRGLAFTLSSVTIAMMLALVGQGIYPRLVPGLGDLSRSLTITNASSTPYTLQAMLVIALLGMPVVIGYTIFIYRSLRGPVELTEHSY